MEKPKICIDLDDTIWEFHKPFFEFYNKKFGTNHSLDNYSKYCFFEFFKISLEEEVELLNEFENTTFSENLIFLEGVKDYLHLLNKKYEIHFVTSRPEFLKERTLKDLQKNLNFEFYLHFIKDKERNIIDTKSDYCKRNKIKIIIEDNLSNLENCAIEGIKCFLLNYPWNQKEDLHSNILRVNNWKEILEELNEY